MAKEAIKARIINVKITWVSNYRCLITKSSNQAAVIGHPRDRAPIIGQIGAQRTNNDQEFCYRYDYGVNWSIMRKRTNLKEAVFLGIPFNITSTLTF